MPYELDRRTERILRRICYCENVEPDAVLLQLVESRLRALDGGEEWLEEYANATDCDREKAAVLDAIVQYIRTHTPIPQSQINGTARDRTTLAFEVLADVGWPIVDMQERVCFSLGSFWAESGLEMTVRKMGGVLRSLDFNITRRSVRLFNAEGRMQPTTISYWIVPESLHERLMCPADRWSDSDRPAIYDTLASQLHQWIYRLDWMAWGKGPQYDIDEDEWSPARPVDLADHAQRAPLAEWFGVPKGEWDTSKGFEQWTSREWLWNWVKEHCFYGYGGSEAYVKKWRDEHPQEWEATRYKPI